ncbi:AbrB/MazE/SpoVT family DNA-binding domain-containing protein [uncultured Lactobacillus sp.]|uniref:AbrB/MazE/SpoVT family DNA-binding domain-containing protein n=1 Tax=uncultured Lactobacillus sp. TaxID=153152 RepID=UPI00343FC7A1
MTKGQIVIPAAIRKLVGLEKGTKASFEVKDNETRIKNYLIFMIGWLMDNESARHLYC